MQFVMIFSLIIAVLSVMFALQNTAVVSLKFFIWTFESPLGLLLLIALTVGAIIISILTLPSWFKNKRIKSIHQKELGELEENLAKYRTDLIDTQNKNKDLRQKVLELEEAKENLEKAHQKTLQEINDLRNALSNAELTAEEAEDLLHNVFLPWVQTPQNLLNIENPGAYLFTSARNAALKLSYSRTTSR